MAGVPLTGVRFPCALVAVLLALTACAALMPVDRAGAALTRMSMDGRRPAGATVKGRLAATTRMHITVALRPRDPAALAAYARAVSAPSSEHYRQYLTPAQFASRFGATRAQVAAVRDSLRTRGLLPGPVSRGGLSISLTATAGELDRALDVGLQRLALPGRRTAIAASAAPAVDARAAAAIQSIVGLSTTSSPHPLLLRAGHRAAAQPFARAHIATTGPAPCPAAKTAAPGQSAYTADEIASAYGFSDIYAAGDLGAGVTVAVYELEPDAPSDLAAYQSCYGTHAKITYVPVDGGSGSGPGSGEAALDIENLIGLAPNANVLVYQGPNSNSGAPGSGPYDTFSSIINQDRARVITVSWGQCEAALGEGDAIAEASLFEQATVQGQSIVAASGDSGAEDCDTGGALPQTQPAVDDPSSQPWVTGVGGTSLRVPGPRPTEAVWNSGGMVLTGMVQPGAGGGGISNFWPMPAAQLNAPASLGIRSPLAAGSACGNPAGYCREVPDVSADADPTTGYLIYWNGRGQVPDEPVGWQGIGGTSGAAPLWAALLTLADASPACSGAAVGFANPALYRAAATAYGADFNDVTTGDNDFTGTNGGRYAATPGYDPVTGLGTPNAGSLVAALCADAVRLPSPGTQRSTIHTSVSLRLQGSDTAGGRLTYRASGLPPGLKLAATSGRISGRPSRTGSFAVRAAARDSGGASAGVAFTWTVGAQPEISGMSLTATGTGQPELAFTVTASHNAPPLQTIAITVPHELRVAAGRGASVTSTGARPARLPFIDHASRGSTLTIKLRRTANSIRVRLTPPGLAARHGRIPATVHPGHARMVLIVSVTDAASGRSQLTAKIAVSRS